MENRKNTWFKFYALDWMTDMKVMELSQVEKMAYVTLLCLASQSQLPQYEIKDLTEDRLFRVMHASDEEKKKLKGIIKKFEKMEMITLSSSSSVSWGVIIPSFEVRQKRALTGYERVKRYREKAKQDKDNSAGDNGKKRNDNEVITDREEKKREEDILSKDNISSPKQKAVKYSVEDLEMVDLLVDLIQQRNPEWIMKGNRETWAEDVNKLHRIDGRTYQQIEFMIKWVQNDSFWQKNILSASKLREKFNDLIPKVRAGNGKGKQIIS